MKLAIIGTRGIPNNYGGFEQVSESLSVGLAARGYDVSVYCSHDHPYKSSHWHGIQLIRCYDAEKRFSTAGQFIYDLNCIRDARRKNFDVLLFMGYTSSSIWGRWFPKNSLVISNMDGLEWKRDKYSKPVQAFLKHAEKLAVKYSHFHIADSLSIKDHLDKKYRIESCYIPYGAGINGEKNHSILKDLILENEKFNMIMARMEPENNIEMVLEGAARQQENKLVVVGNTNNNFGRRMKEKFKHAENILFTGSIFEKQKLNSLRSACNLYLHGHSVGGTNPSLLEAMASGALLAAHDNPFNKNILGNDAFYFKNANEVSEIIHSAEKNDHDFRINNNLRKIEQVYNWENVVDQYDRFIRSALIKSGK